MEAQAQRDPRCRNHEKQVPGVEVQALLETGPLNTKPLPKTPSSRRGQCETQWQGGK